MRYAHISRRQAEARFDGMDADYEDVFAVQAHVAATVDAAELAEVHALLDGLDAELEAADQLALVRVPRFTDPGRAGRSRRRSDRAVLRSLPVRLDVADLVDGEAA